MCNDGRASGPAGITKHRIHLLRYWGGIDRELTILHADGHSPLLACLGPMSLALSSTQRCNLHLLDDRELGEKGKEQPPVAIC